jgi:hypothetical protein
MKQIKRGNTMQTRIAILLLVLAVLISGCVQPPSKPPSIPASEAPNYTPTGNGWAKVFEGLSISSAQLTSDGGYIVLGDTANGGMKGIYGYAYSYGYLFKVDSNGSKMWNRTFRIEGIWSVKQTSDNGYMLAGSINKRQSDGSYLEAGNISDMCDYQSRIESDVYLEKLDAAGNILWNRTFDMAPGKCDVATSVQQNPDGSYTVFGDIRGCPGSGNTLFFLKTDADGNKLSEKTVEFEGHFDYPPALVQKTSDGGYLIDAGIGDINLTAGRHLFKIDANGTRLWDRPIEEGTLIILPSRGFMVIQGDFVLRFDENGNQLEKDEPKSEISLCYGMPHAALLLPDGGYVIAKEGACLIKVDANGNTAWERQLVTGEDFDVLEPLVFQTSDNGFVVIGNAAYGWLQVGGGYASGKLGEGETSIIMVKTDESGSFHQAIAPKYPTQPRIPASEKITGKEQNQPGMDILGFFTGSPMPAAAEAAGPGWNRTFGGDFNSRANSIQQTSDGGYIVAGYKGYGMTYPSGLNGTIILEKAAAYLLKIDSNGSKAWEKSFGGIGMSACSGYDNIICSLNQNNTSGWLGETVGRSVRQTSDGGYIIVGAYHSSKLHNRTSSSDHGFFEYDKGGEVYLVKTDASGNMQWNKTFGEYWQETGNSVRQTSDGGYFIVGTTDSFGTSPCSAEELGQLAPEDIYLIKTDANGNEVWKKTFGGAYNDMAFSVQQTSDGGYIVAGLTASLSGNGVEDVYLLKIDANGNKMWEKAFGDKDRSEAGYSVQQTSDGGYIIAGQTVWAVMGQWFIQSDVYLIKTDANGNEIWKKTFGGNMSDFGRSVQQTSDGGYIIAGFTGSFEDLGATYLIKTDANGTKLWEKTFEGISGISGMISAQQTSDGGYIISAGNIRTHDISTDVLSYGTGDDAYIIKTDENGNV